MPLSDDQLELVRRYADGQASADDVTSLERQLRDDDELRLALLEYLHLDGALEALASPLNVDRSATDTQPTPVSAAATNRGLAVWHWALAASLLLALGVGGWFSREAWLPALLGRPHAVALQVLEVDRLVTSDDRRDLVAGASTTADRLALESGSLRFRLDSGAIVAVAGPAELELVDSMHLRVARGKVTVDIADGAKGFVVDTQQTHIVDLGTRFGVEVTDANHTDVVVFQGEVELFDQQMQGAKASAAARTKLVEGEAVRVDAARHWSRIENVTAGPKADDWSTQAPASPTSVITAVRDNWRDPHAKSFYRIVPGGLREDAVAFIGKRHEWNGLVTKGIPEWLLGADFVQTFSGDRRNPELQITVTVARPAVVYVFFDDRHDTPDWLSERFTNTGTKIGLENAPTPQQGLPVAQGPGAGHLAALSVWKCELSHAGSIKLGPPYRGADDKHWNWMYGIAAKALPVDEKKAK